MRVLLTSHCDSGTIGGTQSWNRTVAGELVRRGHDVTMRGRRASMWPHVDLAIVSQNTTFEKARAVAERTIYVSHGPSELEHAPAGADEYVAVSDEIVRLRKQGPWNLIRQPIDTEFWKPGPGQNIDVLRFSYYGGMAWLPDLCAQMGLTFHHLREEPSSEACRNWCRGANVIIASGRSALEGMSCGRPVIIADQRPYNGKEPLGESDHEHAMLTNYSGRGGHPITPNAMEVAIRYQLGAVPTLRGHVLKYHDVRNIVDQLLALVPEAVTA